MRAMRCIPSWMCAHWSRRFKFRLSACTAKQPIARSICSDPILVGSSTCPAPELLASKSTSEVDIALIIADGLSATAAQRHAAEVVRYLMALLTPAGFTVGPVCIARQARVAIADQIGMLLKARLSIILIGERPGLGLADSLGAYLTYQPTVGKTDADRNCVSNINPRHLPPAVAAATLFWLTQQSLRRQLSGVYLNDESSPAQSLYSLQKDNQSQPNICDPAVVA